MLLRLPLLLGLAVPLACTRSVSTVYAPFEQPAPELASAPVELELWDAEPQLSDPVRDVVYTDPGELPRLQAAGVALPLRNTDVRAHLRGDVAEVVVTQRFVNDQATPLEAIYVFPLPENSAVTDMRMVIGARVIAGEIRERGQAQRIYQQARASGHTAALLEQERPNVFTQSVANIPPGESIEVEIRYLQTLSYDAGEYEFVFPTVVGPRYLPGDPLARAPVGSGGKPDTDRVPDASRISPPVLGLGTRTGNDLSIEVVAEAGSPITAWAAPAHAVEALAAGDNLHVRLARRDEVPNRDFVLRYRSAGARPAAKLFLGPAGPDGAGHFYMVVEPPRLNVDELVGARELIFVIDVSGSMSGQPLALAKAALRQALAGARPVDTFDVITFSGRSARLFGAPRPANAENLARAGEFVDGLVAGGGTEMGVAVAEALHAPVEGDRHRYVFVMTDGYTGEEAAIAGGARRLVEEQRRRGRRARVFGVGIGAAPNQHLLAMLSQAGDGVAFDVRDPGDLPGAARTFRRTIDSQVLTNAAIDWSGMTTRDLSPATVPDLFASRPATLHGRYSGTVPATLQLRGTIGNSSVTIPIEVVASRESDATLARLWARDRVGALELSMAFATSADESTRAREAILQLGLQHRLVTPYTSFIAVDSSRRVDGPLQSVVQPVEVPEGVDAAVAGASGTRIDMQQMRNIPVGGTARDFTAVVDLSPTASRDAGGIRLSGSTGAEAKYTVDGMQKSDWTFGSTGTSIMVDGMPPLSRGFVAVEPYARARVRGVTGASAREGEALRAVVRARGEAIGRCFTDAAPATYRIHRKLVLVVRRSPDGSLATLELRGKALDPRTGDCLRGLLAPELHTILRHGRTAELELSVWMRF